MNLYLLTTTGLGDYYVVASDPTSAECHLKSMLDSADYGYTHNRKVVNIKLMATKVQNDFGVSKRPNFSSGDNLILTN